MKFFSKSAPSDEAAAPKPARRFQPLTILPVLVTITVFILSFLILFAGHKPGFMNDYSVLTLNTSRIGENLVQDLDNNIMALNISKIVDNILTKRSSEEDIAVVVINNAANPLTTGPTPTTLITLAPTLPRRDIDSFMSGLTSKAGDFASEAGSDYTSVKSAVASQVTAAASAIESSADSLESAALSKIESAWSAIQTAVVNKINETYTDMIDDFDIEEFYAVHLMTTCTGHYVYPNGTNLTAGVTGTPPNGTQSVVDACGTHFALDPLVIVRILYEIAIVFVAIALVLSFWGCVKFSKKIAVVNILVAMPAVLFLGLASAAMHGLAVGAAHLIDFVGSGIGIEAAAGSKIITMTWAATILLLVDLGLWVLLLFVGDKAFGGRGKGKGTGEKGEQYEMGGN